MSTVATYTKSGGKATTPVKLDDKVFGVTISNHELLRSAYEAYLANGRVNLAVTKTRGEVSGGGKKPWRQKGTGRARFGSSRVPIWRGGGITFGPTGNENYSKKLGTAAKRQALCQALTLAKKDNKLMVVEAVAFAKTSEAAAFLKKIDANKRVLLVVDKKDDAITRPTNNLAKVGVVQAHYLTVFDLLNADHVVMTKKALEEVTQWLGGKDE